MSHDPEPTVHSRDVVHVRVVRLTGVRIVVPSTKLVVGQEVGVGSCDQLSCHMTLQVAVHAEGDADETPFTFASSVPGLVFHWSVTNMDVHALSSVYDKVLL